MQPPMMLRQKARQIALSGLIAVASAAPLAQPPAEQQWWSRADVIGEPVELTANATPYRALHRPNQAAEPRGAALILHDPGGSADGAGLIRQLRLGLSDAGWETLSLQLPRFFLSESEQRWLDRHGQLGELLAAGTTWLSERGQLNQVIIGVGASGRAALAFAAGNTPEALQALVLVSTPIAAGSKASEQLSEITMPILDLYAERDRRDVLDAATSKRQAASENQSFAQRVVSGTDDRFRGTGAAVTATIRAWLAVNADGSELKSPP
jgi:hypothetical protein